MADVVRRMPWPDLNHPDAELLLAREWLITNGLGGYASGTIAGVLTRRYHGLLIASLPAPLGRIVMLSHLSEALRFPDGEVITIGGGRGMENPEELSANTHLTEFRIENGLPIWDYEVNNTRLEKRVLMVHMQNTVHASYRLLSGEDPVRLELRPLMLFRPHNAPVSEPLQEPYQLSIIGERYELSASPNFPPLRLLLQSTDGDFTVDRETVRSIFYRSEAERGYESQGVLWSPGYFSAELHPGQKVTLIASTESWPTVLALQADEAESAERRRRQRLLAAAHPEAHSGTAAELVLAADQFIITPAGRVADTARARAAGDEVRSIIAGYHWFTDWGRDTMISLEGLTLTTGRHAEAGWILRAFARYIHDGLIPNLFPEGENEGLYHTADATLWFFHALDRYLEVTQDRTTLTLILPKLIDILEQHRRGTHFGIGVDLDDGLLCQGQEGYQLTWMDAKVEDWVVTPRRGKAVEINALWYNALRLLEGWVRDAKGDYAAKSLAEQAEQAHASFNRRFWYAEGGYLYDVIDGPRGNDAACRPNQVLAISLRHPILEPSRWEGMINVVRQRLLTPVGLRSLASDHPEYKPKYFGDLRARDAAYHQGTVWPWLIGPFIDAWLRIYPTDRLGARRFLNGLVPHLDEACLGTISEIFDADLPFTPRGCIAQAWSVAEVLRCWVKTAE
ncbi:MAG TPA: amylo-alpha-1,6-glucosidase [Candidatus Tectomicrobia bacterium]|nr:amylo-alpha-1,6-glucosidase [Candidatus Tectomicrobia bacterium]